MHTDQTDDKQLIQQYLEGRESALNILIDRHKDKVYSSIYMFVKDESLAEDIFQETFIKVVDTLRSGKYKEEGKFLPWVMRIANNLCIDYYRKTKRAPKVATGDGFDIFDILVFDEDNAEDEMIKGQSRNKIKKLINELPREQREVLIMRHYSELSFKEIARITDVSINTALGRMRYALINLRKMIEEKKMTV